MKKFLAAMLVLLFAFAVYAEDRLSMYGQIRVRGFYKENFSDFNNDNDSDKLSYFDQRVRVGMKIKVGEDVSVNIRADLADGTWGAKGQNTLRNQISGDGYAFLDKAYVEVNKDMWMLRFGQQYFGFGDAIVVDHIGTGFLVNLKLPVMVTLAYTKLDENGANPTDLDEDNSKDKDFYGIQVAYKNDLVALKAFYAGIINKGGQGYTDPFDDTSAEADFDKQTPQSIGLQAKFNLGMVAVNAEFDYFFGKYEFEDPTLQDYDYVGTQLYVNPEVKLDIATVGANFYYALGTDKDDEIQIAQLTDFGSFLPTDVAGLKGDSGMVADYLGGNIFMVDDNAGVIGGDIYAVAKPMKNLSVYAQVGYLTPEEDSVTDLNSITFLGGGVTYGFATNTAIQLAAGIAKPDYDGNVSDDTAKHVTMKLYTNF